MINLQCFTVRDSKTELYVQPFFSPTCASALRSFETAANDPQSDFHKHPNDYTLFHIGTFDQDSGMFSPLESPSNLGMANALITKEI